MHPLGKKMIKNGAIWCNLSVPKYVILNLKLLFFKISNQQSHIFFKINPDVHAVEK